MKKYIIKLDTYDFNVVKRIREWFKNKEKKEKIMFINDIEILEFNSKTGEIKKI